MTQRILLAPLVSILVSLLSVVNAFAFKLPDTGQGLCYSNYADVIDCEGTGQDGEYNINPMSYTDNGDGTVTDNNTGLMWQKCHVGQNNDASCSGVFSPGYNWYQASGTYDATYNSSSQDVCGAVNLGGHSDWRLPSIKELVMLVDLSISSGMQISPIFANSTNYYWSSTADVGYPNFAWTVNYAFGVYYDDFKKDRWPVRCVRGEQSNEAFIDNGNGTVTDSTTGLLWQKGEPGVMTWDEALSYCNGLNLTGHIDWRLPNIKELESITDFTIYDPINPIAIHRIFFPNAYPYDYWSSTSNGINAFTVEFARGVEGAGLNKTYNPSYVRCVRGQSGSSNLSISEDGAGSGTILSSPAGINCGGFCSAYYPINSSVVLTATPSIGGSIFSGWSGDFDCLDGAVALNTDKACVATFDLCDSMSVAMTDAAGPFDSIKASYEGASSPDTIRIIASNQQEGDLVFADKNLTFQGGYDCAFKEPPTTYTTITGSLTISGGSLYISGIRIQ